MISYERKLVSSINEYGWCRLAYQTVGSPAVLKMTLKTATGALLKDHVRV